MNGFDRDFRLEFVGKFSSLYSHLHPSSIIIFGMQIPLKIVVLKSGGKRNEYKRNHQVLYCGGVVPAIISTRPPLKHNHLTVIK